MSSHESKQYVLELSVPPADQRAASSTSGTNKTIVGYCWPWTARQGEHVEFKVSTFADGDYEAQLVRIICGDNLTKPDRYREEELPATFAGVHPGRHQPTYPGSFVEIPASALLNGLGSFTAQTFFFPTHLPSVAGHEQHLISRCDSRGRMGWALLLDEQDRLCFRVSGASAVHEIAIERRLDTFRWYLAIAAVDIERRLLKLTLQGHSSAPTVASGTRQMQVEAHFPHGLTITQAGSLRFAACPDDAGSLSGLRPTCCFNGRLDRVRLVGKAIDFATAQTLCAPNPPAEESALVGFWDFSVDMGRVEIVDRSGNGLHGTIVNAPMRAVAGIDWDGSVHDWRHAPQHYSAIHFHDDDLYDARWQTDFRFCIPEDMPSGIYAARLRHGQSEDYVPFFVAPPRGAASAPVALLLPTASYTAYTNVTSILTARAKTLVEMPDGKLRIEHRDVAENTLRYAPEHVDFLLSHRRELGAGVYGHHTDGTHRAHASQKHPNLSVKPKGMNWTLVADTYLVEWLEHKKIRCDILTDDLLHREGVELLRSYRVVLTGNHPEYFSKRMWDAVAMYQQQGGRWMYLGGNGFYWVASYHDQLPGLIEVRKSPYVAEFERRHAFDGAGGGLWRDNARPPQSLTGVGTSGVTLNSACAYRRLPGSYDPRAAFVFEGVENALIGDFGLIGGGAAGQEVDRIGHELGTPSHALNLARADALHLTHPEAGESAPPRADMVFFEGPCGGAVFSVGSMAWVGALSHNGYENDVSRITENVLRRFMSAQPFEAPSLP